MLTINKLKFRNFMSYGNPWSEVDLSTDQLTAIVGKNGVGKTTMINALTFVLYNKSFNGAPKSKLINAINGKQLLVEVQFTSNNVQYTVQRGIKPAVFKIFKADQLINEDSNSRDYQDYLENHILRMNYKTFVQTVVVGTASYTPFMELNTADRRTIVEDLLGAGIVTTMSGLLKQRAQINNTHYNENQYTINTLQVRIDSINMVINTLLQNQQSNRDQLIDKKNKLLQSIDQCNKQYQMYQQRVDQLTPVVGKYNDFLNAMQQIQSAEQRVLMMIESSNKQQTFITSNDVCPTCRQSIDQQYKQQVNQMLQQSIQQYTDKLSTIKQKLDQMNKKSQSFDQVIKAFNDAQQMIRDQQNTINILQNQINEIQQQIVLPNDDSNIAAHQNTLNDKSQQLQQAMKYNQQLLQQKQLIDQASVLLQDTGVKAMIVNQYLPIINQMINKYLADMDFYVTVELDNQFNETIKARGRDNMTYQNLSQGERRRLDMAIMFTWRYIAQLRNSCACNNIFVDEILDSSLDGPGIDSVMKLFKSFKNSYVLVVSHRESVQDLEFDRVLQVEKRNQYSVIV